MGLMAELLTYNGQLHYYLKALAKALKNRALNNQLAREIVDYAIDLHAVEFQCIDTFIEDCGYPDVYWCCVLSNNKIVSGCLGGTLKL